MKNAESIKKTTGFLISSLTTGALYAGLLFLFDSILRFPNTLSVSLAYCAAMVFYFITNKVIIFKTIPDKKIIVREAIEFFILILINYGITLGIVTLVKSFTGEIYSGSLLAGVVTILLTYFIFDRYIFTQKK